MTADPSLARCPWCGDDPLYVAYHDTEWGVPEHDGRALWEKLALDGFQAGLAWITILRKREGFRARFEGFDPARLARWGEAEVSAALADPSIVRHRGKIEATVGNARRILEMGGAEDFASFCWEFVGGRPTVNRFAAMAEVPARTETSGALAKALVARGFRFCGPTVVYAWMQAVGMVNDHLVSCPRHAELAG